MTPQPQDKHPASVPSSERPEPPAERKENKRVPLRIMGSLIAGIAVLGGILLWVFSRMPSSG